MSEDDEDVLARLGTSRRVDKRFSDVGMVHVQIATENTPEHTFKGGKPSAVNGTSNEPVQGVNAGSRGNTETGTYSRSN